MDCRQLLDEDSVPFHIDTGLVCSVVYFGPRPPLPYATTRFRLRTTHIHCDTTGFENDKVSIVEPPSHIDHIRLSMQERMERVN